MSGLARVMKAAAHLMCSLQKKGGDCFGNNKRLQRNIVIPDDLTLRIAVVASSIVMHEILYYLTGYVEIAGLFV